MNVEKFRLALKKKWLTYYQENRSWLVRLGVWVTCQGQRRPSSSFILATLSILEPKLTQLLPFVVDLNNNPDRIILSLGLNFNPDEELSRLTEASKRLLSGDSSLERLSQSIHTDLPVHSEWPLPVVSRSVIAQQDEDCLGNQQESDGWRDGPASDLASDLAST